MQCRVVHLVVILVLLAGLIPPSAIHAQQGPTPEDLARLNRALAAAAAANTYTSYVAVTENVRTERAIAFLGEQVLQDSDRRYQRTSRASTITSGPSLNLSEQTQVHVENTLPGWAQIYDIDAETRVVDDVVYTTATYQEPDSDFPAVPEGWIAYATHDWLSVWPGLDLIGVPETLARVQAGAPYPLFMLDFTALQPMIDTALLSLESSEQGADGKTLLSITASLTLDLAVQLQLFNDQDPLAKTLLSYPEDQHFEVSFVLDQNDRLVELGYLFTLHGDDLDVSGMNGAPNGTTLDLDSSIAYTVHLDGIDEPLTPVAAPELAAEGGLPAFNVPAAVPADLPWWNGRVFYEIFVRSFSDSDGDGIGDLRGVIEKLDYLNDGDPATTTDLGITGIWLMPIMQSPSYHGYDVTDYLTVEEDYGTNDDFKALMQAAHERGIAVIVDLVMNHTSSQHPWFLASAQGDPTYADWYIWRDDPPGDLSPWGSPVWHPLGNRAYFGLFWEGMPDLNYHTPAVTDEMHQIIRFWLDDMGADGFRLDAVRHLIEDGPTMENVPATLAWLDGFDDYVHTLKPEALTVGEVWDATENVVPYVPDRVDIAFEFEVAQAVLNAARLGLKAPLVLALNDALALYPPEQFATFLTNHDQNRVFDQLGGDEGAARVAASVLLTGPGVPFIYYGEEMGMSGSKPDERIRTPMQWDDTRLTGGFTTGVPWQRLANGYRANNVAAMQAAPDSLLNHYRALISLRSAHPALQTGALQLVESGQDEVYSFLRYGEDEAVLVVINLGREAVTDYVLTADQGRLPADVTAELLYGEGSAAAPQLNAAGGFTDYVPVASLAPQSTTIIALR